MSSRTNLFMVSILSRCVAVFCFFGCWTLSLWAAASGSLSGTIKDPSGAVVSGAAVTLVNIALKSQFTSISNGQGIYVFSAIPAGRYDLTVEAAGFKTHKKTNLTVDTDAALKMDVALQIGERTETVVVEATAAATQAQVDTV